MIKTVSILLSLCLTIGVFSQNTDSKDLNIKKLKFGIGIGIGYVDAGEVNDFVSRYYDTTDFTWGFPELYIGFNGSINLQYFVINNLELCAELVGSIAPKYISAGDPSFYYLAKFSPGLSANYHFTSSKRNNKSFFVGAGVNYNFLVFNFDNYKVEESTPGILLQIGWLNRIRSKSIKYGITFNYAETDNLKSSIHNEGYVISKLSYSGINLGAIFYF